MGFAIGHVLSISDDPKLTDFINKLLAKSLCQPKSHSEWHCITSFGYLHLVYHLASVFDSRLWPMQLASCYSMLTSYGSGLPKYERQFMIVIGSGDKRSKQGTE